jgi:hypothetical protein
LALGAKDGLPAASTRSAKESDSGQMPESMTPMTMSSPALFVPPSMSQSPPLSVSPRNAGVVDVSME